MVMLGDLGITNDDIVAKIAELLIDQTDVESLCIKARDSFVAKIAASAEARITALLDETLANIADAEFRPVDEWGEPKRDQKTTTLRELLKTKAVRYLGEKVDEYGKASQYRGTTRAEWLAQRHASEAVDKALKEELTATINASKEELRKRVRDFVAQQILGEAK